MTWPFLTALRPCQRGSFRIRSGEYWQPDRKCIQGPAANLFHGQWRRSAQLRALDDHMRAGDPTEPVGVGVRPLRGQRIRATQVVGPNALCLGDAGGAGQHVGDAIVKITAPLLGTGRGAAADDTTKQSNHPLLRLTESCGVGEACSKNRLRYDRRQPNFAPTPVTASGRSAETRGRCLVWSSSSRSGVPSTLWMRARPGSMSRRPGRFSSIHLSHSVDGAQQEELFEAQHVEAGDVAGIGWNLNLTTGHVGYNSGRCRFGKRRQSQDAAPGGYGERSQSSRDAYSGRPAVDRHQPDIDVIELIEKSLVMTVSGFPVTSDPPDLRTADVRCIEQDIVGIMRGHHHTQPLPGQSADIIRNRDLIAVIQIGCGLIHEEEGRSLRQRPSDQRQLPLTTADLRIGGITQMRQTHSRQAVLGDCKVGAGRRGEGAEMRRTSHGDDIQHLEWKWRHMALRHIADCQRETTPAPVPHILPIEKNAARHDRMQSEDLLNSVVLPTPFGPSRQSRSPERTVSETSLTIALPA